ncbi:aldo-keto reductase [Aulographum hederae CBS 113979]|uniref:Aldo-keto reductase n=1 Tax=Aulographum hederae CBS 113979 TaxID=1176131 RepID=A0A6G1GZK8_9PEZI|nr:aldo-keto reductase [Aulographum hederae CBS 113979]
MADEIPAPLAKSVEETKVSYTQLGKSGLRVSVPILGAMSFGDPQWAPWVLSDEDAVLKLLKGAFDRGLNTWDTAPTYSNGASEAFIGRAIKHFDLPRHKLVLLSKVFGTVAEQPDVNHMKHREQMKQSKDYVNQGGLSRAAIFFAVKRTLGRLQTDYLDLLQIHRFDPTVPIEETMKALHDLVQSGKVRYIGASSMWAYQFAMLQFCAERNGWTKFISMQNHYSLCYREEEREMNPYCHLTGVGLIPWAPLYRGHLARPLPTSSADETTRHSSSKNSPMFKDLTGADPAIIERVQELAEKKGWAMSQVALAWIVQKGTVPIVGFSSLERVDEACGVRGKRLEEEEMRWLEELYEPKGVLGHM